MKDRNKKDHIQVRAISGPEVSLAYLQPSRTSTM